MPHSRRDFLLGGALTVGLLISGCSADPAGTASSSKAPATTPPPPPAEEVVVLAFTPPAGAQNINPLDPVTVTATTGTVTTVRLADADGKPVPGDLDSGTDVEVGGTARLRDDVHDERGLHEPGRDDG